MTEPFVAAIDGGGSKTAAAIAFRDGRVVLPPQVEGCNPQDKPDWAGPLADALRPLTGACHVVLGLGGYGEVPTIDALLDEAVLGLVGRRVTIMNDVILAARAGFPDGGGVLILSGTGSMAVAAGPRGTVRVGGWGDLFSDEGSANWIGREALARASRERDGRTSPRGLADGIEAGLRIAGGGQFALLGWAIGQKHARAGIASLARIVDALAEQGLDPAREILADAAAELATLGRAAAAQAGLSGPQPWSWAGSVFRSRILRDHLSGLLGAGPVTPAAPALAGGLILAARAAGWDAGPGWRDRVIAGCR